jgi:membrane associated rhomboid family serine protease
MRPVRLGSVAIPPLTFGVLATLLAVFLVSGIVANFVPALAVGLSYLPVSTDDVMRGEVWRLFSYALLHDLRDPFHLLFNGLAIYFFGRELEDRWGLSRYALFLVATVVVGGLAVVAVGAAGIGVGRAIGASAFSEGLCVAWGLTYRDRMVRLFMAIPVRGITMVGIAVAFWVLDAVSLSSTSAAAHFGGMVTAAVLVLGVWRPNHLKAFFANLREKLGGKKQPKLYVVPRPDDKKWVN